MLKSECWENRRKWIFYLLKTKEMLAFKMIVPDIKLGEWGQSSSRVSLLEELLELAGLVRLNCLK